MPLSENQLKRMEASFGKALDCNCEVCVRNFNLLFNNIEAALKDWQAVMQKRGQDGLSQMQCLVWLTAHFAGTLPQSIASAFRRMPNSDGEQATRVHARVALRKLREAVDEQLKVLDT